LILGVRSAVDCDEDVTTLISGAQSIITSVEQHYCVFTFERIQNDFGDSLNDAIGKCLPFKRMSELTRVMAQLNEVCSTERGRA